MEPGSKSLQRLINTAELYPPLPSLSPELENILQAEPDFLQRWLAGLKTVYSMVMPQHDPNASAAQERLIKRRQRRDLLRRQSEVASDK